MGWAYLLLAGISEVIFTTALKLSEDFTKLVPTVAFIISIIISFWFLTKAMETIPLGTAYAVWTGIGVSGTVIIGLIYFKDPAGFWRLFFLATLLISIIGLKFSSPD